MKVAHIFQPVSRIDQIQFTHRLGQSGGHLSLASLRQIMPQLEAAGVSQATLESIARSSGAPDRIEGAELSRLYEAIAVRGTGTARTDIQVSDELFRELAARVEHNSGAPGELS